MPPDSKQYQKLPLAKFAGILKYCIKHHGW